MVYLSALLITVINALNWSPETTTYRTDRLAFCSSKADCQLYTTRKAKVCVDREPRSSITSQQISESTIYLSSSSSPGCQKCLEWYTGYVVYSKGASKTAPQWLENVQTTTKEMNTVYVKLTVVECVSRDPTGDLRVKRPASLAVFIAGVQRL